ncbi:MAG TPA: hypothetical protein VD966_02575, partial [Pyrinomonadaceae bacterium]|nr:hypothetical protein [Pyrinomonadaceae bacterium]
MSSNVSDSIAGNPATPQAASNSPAVLAPTEQQESRPGVPKKITNAQTVCNERNEKGKLCNGHLKQMRTGGEEAAEHLGGDDVLFKCQACGTLYMGPPLGHVRDPDKQSRFVQRELTALLQAAGGTLPLIRKNEKGVYVLVEEGAQHAPAKPAHAATTPAPAAPGPSVAETPEEKKARLGAEATARMKAAEGAKPAAASPAAKPAPKPTGTAKSLGPIPGAS